MDVKTLCLGGLSLRPASGYELRKLFEEGPFAHFQEAAFGSIYPALKALAADGLIAECDAEGEGRADKRVYRVTPAGRAALYESLLKPPTPDRFKSDFVFVTFFGHLLPPAHLERLIDEQIADLKAEVAAMEVYVGKTSEAGFGFTLGLGLAVNRSYIAYLEEHRHELVGAAMLRGVGSKSEAAE